MTTPPPAEPLAVAADAIGQPIEDWVRERREVGASWDVLAAKLNEITAGQARPVSREYLRTRFGHIDRFTVPS